MLTWIRDAKASSNEPTKLLSVSLWAIEKMRHTSVGGQKQDAEEYY